MNKLDLAEFYLESTSTDVMIKTLNFATRGIEGFKLLVLKLIFTQRSQSSSLSKMSRSFLFFCGRIQLCRL